MPKHSCWSRQSSVNLCKWLQFWQVSAGAKTAHPLKLSFSSIGWWEGVSLKKYIYISCIVPGGSSGFPETTYSCLVSRWHVFLKLGDWGRHNRRPLFKGWPEAPKHQMHVFRMIWYTSFSWITYCPWHAVLQKHHCVPKECAVLKWVQNLLEASAPPLWQLAFFLWQ